MTNKQIAWSYSALSSYETCPRRHYLTRIAKEVSEPQSKQILYGNAVHKSFEQRLRNNAPLPDHLAAHESLIASLKRRGGLLLVECKWAITQAFTPVTYFDPAVWCRSVVDVGIVNEGSAVLLDWKTGKRKLDTDQLKLSAAMAFAHYPAVDTVSTGYVWTADAKLDRATYRREQLPELWATFLPRVARLVGAAATQQWEPKPSGLCRKWCPVPHSKCEFSGS